MKNFHVYSNGAATKTVIFSEDTLMVRGMNLIAITAFRFGVRILCLNLLGTHFHLIVSGDFLSVQAFCKSLRRNVCRMTGKIIELSMDEIMDETELKNKFMYVLRNPIEAGFPLLPHEYRWGPGNIYFTNYRKKICSLPRIGDLTIDKRRNFFHTKEHLPECWKYHPNHLIEPGCYIDIERAEAAFGSVKAYIAFMFQKKDLTISINYQVNKRLLEDMTQKELREKAAYRSKVLFQKSLSKTDLKEKIGIAVALYTGKEVSSTLMLAKVLEIEPALLEQILKGR